VLLTSGNDLADAAPGRMLSLEKKVSDEVIDNIRKTLTPYLGARNFQVSVAARLNTDKKQTNETIYNPDSRVERSVRTMKQSQVSQNSSAQPATTVEQNLPQQQVRSDDGKQSNEENQKKEETTNYELSSKVITTVSGGYSIDALSVAVLVNKSALLPSLGDKATPEQVDKQIAELQQLIASAAGASKERGDNIKVAAVDFIDSGRDLEPLPPPAWSELLLHQSGNVLNAATILIVALLLIWFGLRRATKALLAHNEAAAGVKDEDFDAATLAALIDPDSDLGASELGASDMLPRFATPPEANLIEDLTNSPRRSPQRRLEQIVEFDEEQAAAILKQWMHRGEAA
jgi:flagellar M-ring protein FliF